MDPEGVDTHRHIRGHSKWGIGATPKSWHFRAMLMVVEGVCVGASEKGGIFDSFCHRLIIESATGVFYSLAFFLDLA